jgi:Sulfotransferase domain
MKLIGAGLPRTATSTQLLAFEQLGFGPVYHMRNLLGNLEGELPAWERLTEGDVDWEAILGDAQSCCDWPTARYYRELAEHFPQAKVLLSVRSGKGWVNSMRETIWPMYFGDSVMRHVNAARAHVDSEWRRFLGLMTHMCWDHQTGGMAGAEDADDAELARIMERWNDGVRASIPPERLLVWNPAEGWEPLCEFLEVPVPEGPVPNVNDTLAFREGVLGGGLGVLNAWWDQRERPAGGFHGADA